MSVKKIIPFALSLVALTGLIACSSEGPEEGENPVAGDQELEEILDDSKLEKQAEETIDEENLEESLNRLEEELSGN
ncbi:MAG: hypothetical protein DWQ01_08930 [Planctomycetota bacterium]|nr:MAG: hypothetical protein DWQ01_08930 [Planctomycetota bacterium]